MCVCIGKKENGLLFFEQKMSEARRDERKDRRKESDIKINK